MKAVLCKEYGPPETLVLEEVASPEPGEGQVRIAVKAAAVNFPDVLIIENKYQFKPPLPFSPGGEVSGVVDKVGPGVKTLKVGDRVIGSCGWGGFAEEIVLEEARCTPFPDEMDFVSASAFLMTYGTSHHALKDRAMIKPGETLLVLGAAGGVGLAAVELGKAMGARVIAAASSEDKVQVARDHGADDGFVYPTGALDRDQQKALSEKIKELTGGQGADVVYDPVGGDYSEPAIRATNWEGRFLVVGFASGPIPKVPLNLALLKGCQIVGVFWGAFTAREPERNKQNLAELMDWFKAGKIKPHVSKTYALSDAASALNDMAARKVKGKIVLVTD
ncbi:NADPH:quinone oxidoreductase family protein [Pyruvatibacter sp.]|uniref:NADPH:quinone oxidoreductase family protein n=1 Tax=Pyruvatibacter sp. TaxID=1981328 RepID=UPI0032EEA28B